MTRRSSARRVVELALIGAAAAVAVAKIVPAVAGSAVRQSVWIDSTMLKRSVPPIMLLEPWGQVEQTFADGTVRVVVVYSPQCRACVRVRQEWERLAEELPGCVEVVAFSGALPDTGSLLNGTRIRTPHVASLGSLRTSLPFRGVPVTVVVSGDGRIVLWVNGAFQDTGRQLIRETVNSILGSDAGSWP